MLGPTDDLEKLLSDVRRTIQENQKFLQVLVSDAEDVNCGLDGAEEEGEVEEFEEL